MREFDPGPPPAFAELFARLPEYAPYKDMFWYDWGPIFYRGRLDGSARVLCVASDPGPTERIAHRTLVGDAGQRVQGFLTKIGLTRSYLCLNAFAYALFPGRFFDAHVVLEDPVHLAWRNELFDAVRSPQLQAVVAFGAQAQQAVRLWPGTIDLPVFEVPHPSSRDPILLLDAWRSAVTQLRSFVTPDPDGNVTLPNYGPTFLEADYARIPLRDLPFGVPEWLGDDAWGRSAPRPHNNCVRRPIPDDRHTLIWIAPDSSREQPAPIETPAGLRYALEGRVVTLDQHFTILERGVVYVDGDRIAAVLPVGAPAPAGYEDVRMIKTGGTIYPGLIELHNHLSYNVLPMWTVDQRYTNRNQWSGGRQAYRKSISGPMSVLGRSPGYVEAVVRYVECKCLLGGVTTSQGVALYSNQGITRYYRGIVRNVEQPTAPDLPAADTRIADVDAADAEKFLARLQRSTCFLLHLSEGTDEKARRHFEALRIDDGTWALARSLAGIHCAALTRSDFETMAAHETAMIWSPQSNLLLYGATADVRAARDAGIRIGLGSDWSPSGSKNLLGELKVARLVSAEAGSVFSDREIVAMATRTAAEILGWEQSLGSLEADKYADLVVVWGRQDDPYAKLLEARETDISLVVINGVPRCGRPSIMQQFGTGTEVLRVNTALRHLNLTDADADPIVGTMKLQEARDRLVDGLRRLPDLARVLEQPRSLDVEALVPQWFLLLDHEDPMGMVQRPYLHTDLEELSATRDAMVDLAAAIPLSELLEPIDLDPLTIADDASFFSRLERQPNLPEFVKEGLPALY